MGQNTCKPKFSLSTSRNKLEKLEGKPAGGGDEVAMSQVKELQEYNDS